MSPANSPKLNTAAAVAAAAAAAAKTANSSVAAVTSQRGTVGGAAGNMAGGTDITYDPTGAGDGGTSGIQTGPQIGGASAHFHHMTHMHTNSSSLTADFNNLVTLVNQMRAKLVAAGLL